MESIASSFDHFYFIIYPFRDTICDQKTKLSKILDDHVQNKNEIDFLTVDCEGHDLEVLRSNNWTKYRPRYVLVEHHKNSDSSDPRPLLEDKGYHFLACLGLTNVFEQTLSQK